MDKAILLIISLITFLIPLLALFKYIFIEKKYNKIDTKDNTSGCEMALKILEANDTHLYVIESNGIYTNTYDSNRDVIKLYREVFHKDNVSSNSLSAILASETLLAKKSMIIKVRTLLLPIVNYLTLFAYIFLLVSIISGSFKYTEYAILIFFVIVLFYLITFNIDIKIANKAKLELKKNRLIKKSEIDLFDEMIECYKYYRLASIYSIILYNISKFFKKGKL